jgi:hypothetical protein
MTITDSLTLTCRAVSRARTVKRNLTVPVFPDFFFQIVLLGIQMGGSPAFHPVPSYFFSIFVFGSGISTVLQVTVLFFLLTTLDHLTKPTNCTYGTPRHISFRRRGGDKSIRLCFRFRPTARRRPRTEKPPYR